MEKEATKFENQNKEWQKLQRFLAIQSEPDPEVNTTNKVVIWKKNKSTLYYHPAEKKKYETPIFIVYSLINKPFILDLAPGASFIEGMVKKGYDVYILDWGEPGFEDSTLSLESYITDYLDKAVLRVLRHSGAKELSVVGYCLGGTMAAIYTAISNRPIKNLILATVPIDFSTLPGPENWVKEIKNGTFQIEKIIDAYGNVPADYMKYLFRMMTYPVYFSPYVTLYDKALNTSYVDKWKRLNKWTEGHIAFAGAAFRQLLNDFLKDNKLIKGEFQVHGQHVDLSTIKSNVLIISSINDQLVPQAQSKPLMDILQSEDKTYQTVKAGHISLALSPTFVQMVDEWLTERSLACE